jgi:hypothetical protein
MDALVATITMVEVSYFIPSSKAHGLGFLFGETWAYDSVNQLPDADATTSMVIKLSKMSSVV